MVNHIAKEPVGSVRRGSATVRLFTALVILLALCFGFSSTADALPRNFRNVDIFYVGAMPDTDDMEEFAVLGIKHIVSLHRLPSEVEETANELGLVTHSYPLRTQLRHVEEIMAILEDNPPGTVFVHCLHGADRTGAITAYWLYTHRGYDPFTALATVISPSNYHLRGLKMLAREYEVNLEPNDEVLGRFSGARNGGLEGLKVRGGAWYTKLARNYLELTVGPPLQEPREDFWEN